MRFFRNRPRRAVASPVLVLLTVITTATGCTSTDDTAAATVPTPGTKKTVTLCRHLDQRLPRHVDGLRRADPAPRSPLTAGWGDPAIILRCGVVRPAEMNNPEASSVEVNGVGWLEEKGPDGSYRFTTTLREAYVEVTLPEERTARGLAPLTDLAAPVQRAIPHGIADG